MHLVRAAFGAQTPPPHVLASHSPLQALGQQTLPTQKPDAQSAVLLHVAPLLKLNVALGVAAAVTFTVHVVPTTVVQPVHDTKWPFPAGVATSETEVP